MNRKDRILFYDYNPDNTKNYYYLTFGELADTFGYDSAVRMWEKGYPPDYIDPFCCSEEEWDEPDEKDLTTFTVCREVYDEKNDCYYDYDNYNYLLSSYSFDD